MTQSMLEKAAAAANAALPYPDPWERVMPQRKELCFAMVRAVLTAIRYPNEAMLEAGHDPDYCPVFKDAWQAAIDSILAQDPTS